MYASKEIWGDMEGEFVVWEPVLVVFLGVPLDLATRKGGGGLILKLFEAD